MYVYMLRGEKITIRLSLQCAKIYIYIFQVKISHINFYITVDYFFTFDVCTYVCVCTYSMYVHICAVLLIFTYL